MTALISTESYAIGWIAALAIERAAATPNLTSATIRRQTLNNIHPIQIHTHGAA